MAVNNQKREEKLCAMIEKIAESGYEAHEVIPVVAKRFGFDLTKPQMRRLEEMKNRGSDDKEWLAANKGNLYTAKDFPDYVIESIERMFESVGTEVNRAVKGDLKRFKEDAAMFRIVDNVSYFTDEGYKFLISISENLHWISYENKLRWMKDSKLYPELEGSI